MKITERRTQDSKVKADKAHTQSAQRDAAFFKERERVKTLNDEKTARLRALRLAKEAVDKEAAAKAALENPAPVRKSRARKVAAAAG